MIDDQRMQLGFGVGWRPELALWIARSPEVRFVEIIAEEAYAASEMPRALFSLLEKQVTIIPHGISLSLGSAEPVDRKRVESLGRLATLLGAPFVSEHIAFVRAGGTEVGHLLPPPRTRESLSILVENVHAAQKILPVPLALENIAALFEWPHAELDEATFLAELLVQTESRLLLDVSNIHSNACNHGADPASFLDRLPLDRLAYVHIGGGIEHGGRYHDTHAHPVAPGALQLLETLCSRTTVPGVLLERDDRFPPECELAAEFRSIQLAVTRGVKRREVAHIG